MKEKAIQVADYLLQIKAIKLDPANPFTWASGWKSPIYCDNRKTLSYPEIRSFLQAYFSDVIREKYPQAESIAGVATGAIAIGALVADQLGLPFVYVRSKPKGHGLGNQVEGVIEPGQQLVVIEDLISTGGSSLDAVKAIREAGGEVLGLVAIFSYEFALSADRFKEARCELTTLSNYSTLIERAAENGMITPEQSDTLRRWREDPAHWDPGK
jgi:orotate phosphoribosyltransferase